MTKRLEDARLYLVAPARLRTGKLADLVPDLAAAGVDVLQLREKDMEAGDVLRAAVPLAEVCASAGVPFVLNDRADVALGAGAAGVHLGTNDLPTAVARRIMGDGAIVGRSTHSPQDIADALEHEDPDYLAVGPVYETPTKPGRPAVGLDLIRHAAGRALTAPWFAIGGISAGNLSDVLAAGARRIVVVRAITEVDDPPAAAAELRAVLDAVPL